MKIQEELQKGKNIYQLNLKVCYYARVSTESDSQTTSIINQINYFNNYIKNITNWTLTKGYIDEGISGKKAQNRKNFQQMIKDGLNHKYDLILTKSVSRFARNTIDSIKYTDILKNNDIGVIFINDNINTLNNDSEFRLTLMASIAQDEIRKLSESVKFGLYQSIKRGIVLGSSNIIGYTKNKGKLKINKNQAKIVQEIYNKFITKKYTYTKLSRYINKKYKTNYTPTTIKRILTNYKYKGYYCGNKTKVINYKNSKRINVSKDKWIIYKDTKNIPPIIKEEVWNKVNNIINKKNNKHNKNPYKIYCNIHNKKYKYITKTYKKNTYNYLSCPNCTTINKKLLDKIETKYKIKKIITNKIKDLIILKIYI